MNTASNTTNLKDTVVTITLTAALAKPEDKGAYGFKGTVKLADGSEVRGLFHKNQCQGRTPEEQEARFAGLKLGDTLEVLVTKDEEVPAKNPKIKSGKVREIAFSERALYAKRAREARQAREAKDEAVLTGLTLGSDVTLKVTEVREIGVFGVIDGGVADGYRALVHVTEFSGFRSKEQRDGAVKAFGERFAKAKDAGETTTLTARVVKVEKNEKGFVQIGLSVKAIEAAEVESEHAALLDRFPVGCQMTGRLVKATADGLILTVSQDGVQAILNVDGDMSAKIQRAKSVRVEVTGVDSRGRLTVEKA